MWPLSKTELQLRVGSGCALATSARAAAGEAAASVAVSAPTERAVSDALEALAPRNPLSARAHVQIEDELLYILSLPATQAGTHRAAADLARRMLDDALGGEPHDVQLTLSEEGSHWLASALPDASRTSLTDQMAVHGVLPSALRAAWVADARVACQAVGRSDALLVLLRREGLLSARLQAGGVAEVFWDRCVVEDATAVEQAVRARQHQWSGAAATRTMVWLQPLLPPQHAMWREPAERLGWRVLAPLLPATPVLTPAPALAPA